MWWLVALTLLLIGIILILMGMREQRRARAATQVQAGLGGPPGSSDVGTHEGFTTPSPTQWVTAGRELRLIGAGFVAAGALMSTVLTLLEAGG